MDIEKIKQKILDLAIRGKLVPQDPNDEPASVLIEKIKTEKEKLVKEGKIKPSKNESYIYKGSDNCYYEKIGDKIIDITKEIPFDIPDNWTWVRLNTITLKIQYGLSYAAQSNGECKYLRITDIQENRVNWDRVPYVTIKEEEKDCLLSDNDIVFARTGGTVGKSFLVKNPPKNATFASYLIRVQLIIKEFANYLYFFFQSSFYWNQIQHKSIGSGQPSCNGTKLASLLVPIAPLNEINRIINRLDYLTPTIDRLLFEKKEITSLSNYLRTKILDFYFGEDSSYKSYYPTYCLKDLCNLTKNEDSKSGFLPYLEAKVIRGSKEPKYISFGSFIKKGTKIILVDGENSGEVMIAPYDGYLCSTFRILNLSSLIDETYLMYFIQFHKEMLRSNKTGSAVPHLNKKIFSSLIIPLPPLETQKEIAYLLNKIDKKLSNIIS